jgi:lauroyl/myristoyl acyltransferase
MFMRNNENPKVKAIIHGVRVGPEEQAHFSRRLTVEEIIEVLQNGSAGKLLFSKTENREDNVVVEYHKED